MLAIKLFAVAAFVTIACSARAASMPDPAKPVDLSRYTGRWYEVARYPNGAEKNCKGVTSDYSQPKPGRVSVLQTCHERGAKPRTWSIRGTGPLLDPPYNSKFQLKYYVVISRDYWVMDQSVEDDWAIIGDPKAEYVWLFSRTASVSKEKLGVMVAAAARLGYKTERFEYLDYTE